MLSRCHSWSSETLRYGPLSESPSRLQRKLLGSRFLAPLAVGALGSLGSLIGLIGGPSLALLWLWLAMFIATSIACYWFSIRHKTSEELLHVMVAYPPSLSLKPAISGLDRKLTLVAALALVGFGIERIAKLSQAITTPGVIILVVNFVALMLAVSRLRRGRGPS